MCFLVNFLFPGICFLCFIRFFFQWGYRYICQQIPAVIRFFGNYCRSFSCWSSGCLSFNKRLSFFLFRAGLYFNRCRLDL